MIFSDDVSLSHPVKCDALSAKDIMLVRASFSRVVAVQGVAADLFYARLFAVAPGLRALFPEDLSEQKRKLVAMLTAGVGKLHDRPYLMPVLKDLGARHVGYGTKPEHYALVGDALLWTLKRCLNEAFTPEVQAAWTKVYTVLTTAMQEGAAEASHSASPASGLKHSRRA